MSLAELKERVDKTTPQARLFLSAYLAHLARQADAGYGRDLDRRWNEMNAGKKIPLAEVLDLDEELKTRGL